MSDYVDGTLPADARATFDAHLPICRDCRRFLDSFRKSRELTIRGLEGGEVKASESLIAAILSARSKASDQ